MGEHIVKIKIEELSVIRLDFGEGEVHEMAIDNLGSYTKVGTDDIARHLKSLGDAIQFFSKKGATPAIEFVVPADKL